MGVEEDHWTTVVKCNLCKQIPNSTPLYQCPLQHQYCAECFFNLQKQYRGSIENGATCIICKLSGVFTESKINADFLRKIKTRPGIGRPCRYSSFQSRNENNNLLSQTTTTLRTAATIRTPKPTLLKAGREMTVEQLFQLPAAQVNLLLNKKSGNTCEMVGTHEVEEHSKETSKSPSLFSYKSKVPIKCPDSFCNRAVAPGAFITHFRHEHPHVPKFCIDRGKELRLPCNVAYVVHARHNCMAMIDMYDILEVPSKDPQCSRNKDTISQQVYVDTFWLMASGSPEKEKYSAHALFWLFCPSEKRYRQTIELSAQDQSMSVSTHCNIHHSTHKLNYTDLAAELTGLIVSKPSLAALLRLGPKLNLRIIVY